MILRYLEYCLNQKTLFPCGTKLMSSSYSLLHHPLLCLFNLHYLHLCYLCLCTSFVLSSSLTNLLSPPLPTPLLFAYVPSICLWSFPLIFFPLLSFPSLEHCHVSSAFLSFPVPFSCPACGRSMTHNWRTWRPLRACLIFVTPSSSIGARLRRKWRTHLSLGNLR